MSFERIPFCHFDGSDALIQEHARILRYDLAKRRQLPDFNDAALPGSAAFDLRLLSGGGLPAADYKSILRLDANGRIVQTYDVPGDNSWFALTLDPDGRSFWSATYMTANFYKVVSLPFGENLITADCTVVDSCGNIANGHDSLSRKWQKVTQ